jgi:AraC-like DNA-binding protein
MQFTVDWYFVFFFFTGLLGLFVACIVYFLNHNQSLAPRLLAVYLLIMSLLVIINSLTFTNFFLSFPHVWRVFAWTHFLAPVVAYLYVRSVVNQSFVLRREDYLLLIPAVIYTFCLVPFYLLPTSDKLEIVRRFMEDKTLISLEPEIMLLKSWSVPAKLAFGLILLAAQFRLLLKWRKNEMKNASEIEQNKTIFRWLFLFTSVISVFYVILVIEYSLHISRLSDLTTIICFTFSLNIFFICASLLSRPSILYGFKGWHEENTQAVSSDSSILLTPILAKKESFTIEQRDLYKQKLEQLFDEKQPYRKIGYKIRELSDELGIPTYQLSAFINQYYGKNFNELLNDFRVDYLTNLAKTTEDFHQYTLDALSREVGFKTRTTFINAVKKRTNQTPSDYFSIIQARDKN